MFTGRKKYVLPAAAPDAMIVNSYSVVAPAFCVEVDVLMPDVLCVPQPLPTPPLHALLVERTAVEMIWLSLPPVLVA